VVCLGLVDSKPIMTGLDEHEEELTKLSGGVQMLIYGMVGWLGLVTVAAVCIFVGVYIRMSRVARSLDDAETGSSISSKSSRSVLHNTQAGHSSRELGKVREFKSGQGKVGDKEKLGKSQRKCVLAYGQLQRV